MKFLIVFIALLLQWKLPLPPRSVHSRSFAAWLALWQRLSFFSRLPRHIKYALLVVLPALLLTAVFWYSERFAWGLLTLALEVLLLLYVLAHVGIQKHLDQYREDLRNGDTQGAYRCAGKYLAGQNVDVAEDATQLNEQVIKSLLHRWFEYFFLMVFWYMVADVGGILLAWLTVQYARTSACDERAWRYLHWLEWIPVRLLGLTFGLAGNLMRALPVWKQHLWQWQAHSADVLFEVANAAMADSDQPRQWHNAADDAEAAAKDLEEWQQLHLRSVSVWMVMIAMATIGGWLL